MVLGASSHKSRVILVSVSSSNIRIICRSFSAGFRIWLWVPHHFSGCSEAPLYRHVGVYLEDYAGLCTEQQLGCCGHLGFNNWGQENIRPCKLSLLVRLPLLPLPCKWGENAGRISMSGKLLLNLQIFQTPIWFLFCFFWHRVLVCSSITSPGWLQTPAGMTGLHHHTQQADFYSDQLYWYNSHTTQYTDLKYKTQWLLVYHYQVLKNLNIMLKRVTIFKCSIQWHRVHSQCCAATTVYFQTFHHPTLKLQLLSNCPPLPTLGLRGAQICLQSRNAPIPDSACKH